MLKLTKTARTLFITFATLFNDKYFQQDRNLGTNKKYAHLPNKPKLRVSFKLYDFLTLSTNRSVTMIRSCYPESKSMLAKNVVFKQTKHVTFPCRRSFLV